MESAYVSHELRRSRAILLAVAVSSWGVPTEAADGFFRGLGFLLGGEYRSSRPFDISGDGTVVVGQSRSHIGEEAFRWTRATGMTGLGTLGFKEEQEPYSVAFGVSADGAVVVGGSSSPHSDGDRGEAFRWSEATGMVGLGDLPGGLRGSGAVSVSSDGSVVTGGSASSLSPNFSEAFIWTQKAGLVGLGVFPSVSSPFTIASRVSADGMIVVGHARTSNGREAFRWTESSGLIALGDLPGPPFESFARSISADGTAIVGLGINDGSTAFRWTEEGGMVDLGRPPGGYCSSAWDTSADGAIVVGDACVAGEVVPAIWDEIHGMRNLEDVFAQLGFAPLLEGWNLEEATGISDDGTTVVGWGYHFGEMEGWIARLELAGVVEVPATSDWSLALLAALLVASALVTLRPR